MMRYYNPGRENNNDNDDLRHCSQPKVPIAQHTANGQGSFHYVVDCTDSYVVKIDRRLQRALISRVTYIIQSFVPLFFSSCQISRYLGAIEEKRSKLVWSRFICWFVAHQKRKVKFRRQIEIAHHFEKVLNQNPVYSYFLAFIAKDDLDFERTLLQHSSPNFITALLKNRFWL